MPPVSRDMVCFRCMKGFMPQDKHISDRGNVFHSECFVCDVCKVPLWNTSNYACLNQKIYCYIHIPEPNSNPMMGAEVYDLYVLSIVLLNFFTQTLFIIYRKN